MAERWLQKGSNSSFMNLILYQLMEKQRDWTKEPSFNYRNKPPPGVPYLNHCLAIITNIAQVYLTGSGIGTESRALEMERNKHLDIAYVYL